MARKPAPNSTQRGGRSKLRNVERFAGASEAEIRAAYDKRLMELIYIVQIASREMRAAKVGSPSWDKWAAKVDRLTNALHPWDADRRARMVILGAVDSALRTFLRLADPIAVALVRDASEAHARGGQDVDDRRTLQRAYKEFPGWTDVRLFEAVKGCLPKSAFEIALIGINRSAPEHARALVNAQAVNALQCLLETWNRTAGRPRKGNELPKKWDAAAALLDAMGLGVDPATLEADWRLWIAQKRAGQRA